MNRLAGVAFVLILFSTPLLSQGTIGGFVLDTVSSGLDGARAMVFAPDGRLFYTEVASGRIMVIDDPMGTPSAPTEFVTVSGFVAPSGNDLGLHGIALHPNFPTDPGASANRYVYVVHTTGTAGAPQFVIKRFEEDTDNPGTAKIGTETNLIASFEMGNSGNNFGGRLAFGPDGRLYVSTGDGGGSVALGGQFAQNPGDRRGKVLRYNADGSIPDGDPVFALGFRNPRGLAFNPNTLDLFGTDSGNPDTSGNDEINTILHGGNYGWGPEGLSGNRDTDPYIDPAWVLSAGFRPSAAAFHPPGAVTNFPEVGFSEGVVYVASEGANGSVHRVVLTGANQRKGVAMKVLASNLPTAARDLTFGEDGHLYVLTNTILYRIRYIGNQSSFDPVADAGEAQTVNAAEVVALDGSGSFDDDTGAVLQYVWRQVGGGKTVTINNPTSQIASFTAPTATLEQDFITFELIVEDGQGGVDNDFVIITVTGGGPDDDTPIFEPPGEGGCSTGGRTGLWWLAPLLCLLLLAARAGSGLRPLGD